MTRSPSPSTCTSTCRPGWHVPLQVHPGVAERRAGLGRSRSSTAAPSPRGRSTGFRPRPPPPPTALTSTGQPISRASARRLGGAATAAARHHRQAGRGRAAARRELVADGLELRGRRTDEDQARGGAGAREARVLGQEPVARGGPRRPPRPARRRRPRRRSGSSPRARPGRSGSPSRPAGPAARRVRVGRREHGLDAERPAGAQDPHGDLASVGDQDPAQGHSRVRPDPHQHRAPLGELGVGQAGSRATVPRGAGADRVHQLHGLDDADDRVRLDVAARPPRTAARPASGPGRTSRAAGRDRAQPLRLRALPPPLRPVCPGAPRPGAGTPATPPPRHPGKPGRPPGRGGGRSHGWFRQDLHLLGPLPVRSRRSQRLNRAVAGAARRTAGRPAAAGCPARPRWSGPRQRSGVVGRSR